MKLNWRPLFFAIAMLGLPQGMLAQQTARELIGDADLWKSLEEGAVVLLPSLPDGEAESEEDKLHSGIAAIIIDAPVGAVWTVIEDKEGAPAYIDNLISARIVEETADYTLVEQVMKLGPLPKVTYVVRHIPIPPYLVNFERESGDLKSIKGSWRFVPCSEGRKTLLIYRLSLKPGFVVPNFLIRSSLKKSLPDALRAVRGEVTKEELKSSGGPVDPVGK